MQELLEIVRYCTSPRIASSHGHVGSHMLPYIVRVATLYVLYPLTIRYPQVSFPIGYGPRVAVRVIPRAAQVSFSSTRIVDSTLRALYCFFCQPLVSSSPQFSRLRRVAHSWQPRKRRLLRLCISITPWSTFSVNFFASKRSARSGLFSSNLELLFASAAYRQPAGLISRRLSKSAALPARLPSHIYPLALFSSFFARQHRRSPLEQRATRIRPRQAESRWPPARRSPRHLFLSQTTLFRLFDSFSSDAGGLFEPRATDSRCQARATEAARPPVSSTIFA